MSRAVDPAFAALPLPALADAALSRARELGAEHAELRVERVRTGVLGLHDAKLETSHDDDERGLSVRVVHDGTWGFAGGVALTTDAAARLAEEAVELARTSRAVSTERVELVDEPAHGDVKWVSSYDVDPFDVPTPERVELLAEWSRRLLESEAVTHADASLRQVRENKFFADLRGTSVTQQRVRMQCQLSGVCIDEKTGRFESMRTTAPPVGRGWEWLSGDAWDWAGELAQLPELLAEKASASSVEPGDYDLVIDPSNLWLTIHESIGHATELDRALGYEANYAGTSFATPDKLGTLRYGSPVMHVTGDRTVEHGLASIGFDDEGVAAQSWDIVRDGTLVGYQLDRAMAALYPDLNSGRSNGCAYADSPGHIPL